jgi:mannose-6-phosphate isomerase-like protein (cupin superfamily)
MINKENSKHYKWGDNCDSWFFVDTDNLSIKFESMPIGAKEKLHYHSKSQQFFYILKGQATFYIENRVEVVNENNGISILPSEKHFISNESDVKLDFLVTSQPSTNQDRFTIDI